LWLCFALPLPDSWAARLSADLSLTIYLAHPMVMAALMRITPLADKSVEMALATLVVTLLVALALQRRSARPIAR
jgi:peptidoglycan/LPS O-acetylase OafA/YrhL